MTSYTRRGRVALAVISTAAALVALAAYWLLRPYDSITFTPFQTDKAVYAQGDVITLSNEFCWDGVPFTATREFQSGVSAIGAGYIRFEAWPAAGVNANVDRFRDAPDGCADSVIRLQIPATLPPGEWSVRYTVEYEPALNPIRTVAAANESNTYTVVAP